MTAVIKRSIAKFDSVLVCIGIVISLMACSSLQQGDERNVTRGDAVITAEIKSRLLEIDGFESLSINVETIDGLVKLSGFVNTEEQRSMAEIISRKVMGVKSVQNTIIIRELKIAHPFGINGLLESN